VISMRWGNASDVGGAADAEKGQSYRQRQSRHRHSADRLIGDVPIPDSFSGGGSSASVFLGFALPKRSRGLFVVLRVTESRDSRRRRRQRLIIIAIVVFAMLAATLAGLVAAFADSSAHPGRACSGTVGSMRATGGDPQSDPACAQTGTGPL